MKYHILHIFRPSTAKNPLNHFKGLYKLELLTNFYVNMTPFLEGVPNYVLTLNS